MPIDQALATGAMALFGEKYGDNVRVVSVPDFSANSAAAPTSAAPAISASSRLSTKARFQQVCAESKPSQARARFDDSRTRVGTVQKLATIVRGSEENVAEHVERLVTQQRALERELDQLKTKLAHSQVATLESEARTLKGVKVLSARVEGLDRQQLRELADSLRNKWKTGIVVLATTNDDSKVSIISAVTKDLTAKVHAGKLAGAVAAAVGGKGGGRPDMAEAGGSNPAALSGALEQVYANVENML